MQRRKFLVGLGSLAAGGAAATGTGALSAIRAERNITGQIVGDGSAYLAINGSGSAATKNGFVVEETGNGEVRLNFDDNNVDGKQGTGGQGLNPDAENWFDFAFRLFNQGPEDLNVWFSVLASPNRISFYRDSNRSNSMVGSGNAEPLPSGEALGVGIYVDTTGLGKGDENALFDGDDDFEVKADTS